MKHKVWLEKIIAEALQEISQFEDDWYFDLAIQKRNPLDDRQYLVLFVGTGSLVNVCFQEITDEYVAKLTDEYTDYKRRQDDVSYLLHNVIESTMDSWFITQQQN